VGTVTETVRTRKVSVWRTVKRAGEVRKLERVEVEQERRRTLKRRPQGLVLYKGPSLLDGKPIVCVAVGFSRRSKNAKTGGRFVQTFIMRSDVDPVKAHARGRDSSVCGDCVHRIDGTCYVNLTQAPLSVWRAFKRGVYPAFNAARHARLFAGRLLRLGAYGDPAAVPLLVWDEVVPLCDGHTGYTHAWRSCHPGYAAYCMASCETPDDRQEAAARGFRTFRVRTAHQPLEPGEFECPASEEQNKRLSCEECQACWGSDGGRRASPSVRFHGPRIAGDWRAKRYEHRMGLLMAREAELANARRVGLTVLN
jgi:hypothetical protein